MFNCPNGHGPLVEVDSTKRECSVCGYSFITPVKRGNKQTEEVNRVIKDLLVEARLTGEAVPWKREWIIIPKRNYDSNRVYSGINRCLLSFDADISFITKDSVEKKGLTIPEEVKPRTIVAWIPGRLNAAEKSLPQDKQQEALRRKRPFMILQWVYRAKDIPGLPEKKYEGDKDNKRFDNVESFIKSIEGLRFEEGGNQPCYLPSADVMQVPRIEQYSSSEEYYRDLFHELVHWTKHESRLNRDEKKYGWKEKYGREELIAEMGASYLCHYFGIPVNENAVAYIDGWLRSIEGDPNILVSAGQQAEKVLTFFGLYT